MLKTLAFPAVFLIAFLVKFLIIPATIAESLAFIGCLSLFGFLYFILSQKEKPVNESVKIDVDMLKTELIEIKNFLQTTKLTNVTRNFK